MSAPGFGKPSRRVSTSARLATHLSLGWIGLATLCLAGDEIPSINRKLREPVATETESTADANQPPQPRSTVVRVVDVLYQSKRVKELRQSEWQQRFQLSRDEVRQLQSLDAALEKAIGVIRDRDISQLDKTLKEYEPLAQRVNQQVSAMLTPQQQKQLLAVVVSKQRGGAFTFLFPGVAEILELTADQQSQIEAIAAADLKFIRGASLFQLPSLLSRSRENRARIEGLLSPQQRRAWTALTQGRLSE